LVLVHLAALHVAAVQQTKASANNQKRHNHQQARIDQYFGSPKMPCSDLFHATTPCEKRWPAHAMP
jgi:hypothetical protein